METTENPNKIEEELKTNDVRTIRIKTLDNQVYTITVPRNVNTLQSLKHYIYLYRY